MPQKWCSRPRTWNPVSSRTSTRSPALGGDGQLDRQLGRQLDGHLDQRLTWQGRTRLGRSPLGRTRLGLAALAVSSLLGAGCDQPEELPPDARVVVDTVDGVPHVVSGTRGAWVAGGSWKVPADSGLVIGGGESAASSASVRISGPVVGDDGRIYVGYGQAGEVRVFSPAGELRQRLAGDGSGPGEFADVSAVLRAPEGMAVVDRESGRVSVFSPAGELQRTFPIAGPAMDGAEVATMAFDERGRFYHGVGLMATSPRHGIRVIIHSRTGAAADTVSLAGVRQHLGVAQSDGDRVDSLPLPFAARPSMAVGPNGQIYFARGDTYEVMVLSPAGDTVRVLRRGLRPRPIRAEERDSALAELDQLYREATGAGPSGAIHIPATKPMIAALHVDREGNLWVAAPRELAWRSMEWAVHDPEGRYLGPVATPIMEVTDIGREYVAGVETDAAGFQRAVVYPLLK